jgi:hypothetical protein
MKGVFQQPPVVLDAPPVPPRHGNRFVAGDETTDGDVTVGTVGTTAIDPTVPTTGIIGTAAAELTPRLPISVDPNGIPVRATPPGVMGDVDVGVEDETMLLDPEPHIPDMPEVSSNPDVVDIPDVADIPAVAIVPDVAAVAGAAVPTPIPPPSKLAVDPNIDDGAIPMVEHVVLLLGIAIVPVASPGAGLTPGDAISVAPRGMPVGETGEPVAVIASGVVVARLGVGLAIPLTCAIAAWQTTSAGRIAAINDSLTGKRARMELLRRIGPQDCRVYALRPFLTPSCVSARSLALTQLNTSLFLLDRPRWPEWTPPFRIPEN